MFLSEQPLKGELDARGVAPSQGIAAAALIQERECDQPPQRGIDAAEIPEIRLVSLNVHELCDLSVGCLMLRKRVQPYLGRLLQVAVSGQSHAYGTDRGVPSEDGCIAAFARARTGRGGENAVRRQIPLQQLDGP